MLSWRTRWPAEALVACESRHAFGGQSNRRSDGGGYGCFGTVKPSVFTPERMLIHPRPGVCPTRFWVGFLCPSRRGDGIRPEPGGRDSNQDPQKQPAQGPFALRCFPQPGRRSCSIVKRGGYGACRQGAIRAPWAAGCRSGRSCGRVHPVDTGVLMAPASPGFPTVHRRPLTSGRDCGLVFGP